MATKAKVATATASTTIITIALHSAGESQQQQAKSVELLDGRDNNEHTTETGGHSLVSLLEFY